MTLQVGDAAPLFEGMDLLTGKPFALADHAGKAILIAFSGLTWCGPCQFEAPVLQDLWSYFRWRSCKVGVQFVMVDVANYSGKATSLSSLKAAIEMFGISFPVLLDAAIPPLYEFSGVPMVFFVGPELKITAAKQGAIHPEQALYDELEEKLDQSAGGLECKEFKIELYHEPKTFPGPSPFRYRLRELHRHLAISDLAGHLDDVATGQKIQTEALKGALATLEALTSQLTKTPAPPAVASMPIRSRVTSRSGAKTPTRRGGQG